MAITIDRATKVISVPQADLAFSSGSTWDLDADAFRKTLDDLQDDEEGIVTNDTHTHTTVATLGGITFARVVEIINGYTIEFEDLQYNVEILNANTNFMDVLVDNQVSVRSNNSGGLILGKLGQADIVAMADAVWDEDITTHSTTDSAGQELQLSEQFARLAGQLAAAGL